jgi:hypothetical protein
MIWTWTLACCLLPLVAANFWERLPWFHNVYRHDGHSSVPRDFYMELEQLSRLVDIAYCIGVQGPGITAPFECPSHCNDFPSVELITTWNTGQMLSDSCGYVALDHGSKNSTARIIVAFRGTYSISNTIVDLSTVPQEYVPYPDDGGPNSTKCGDCAVHMGFYESWKNTREEILPVIKQAAQENPSYQLVVVGHSLGGAVAALAGMELQARGLDPTVTTFGEPRIGNQALADFVDKQFGLGTWNSTNKLRRITHNADPVPHLPLAEWGYVPHSGEIYISKPDLPPEPTDLVFCEGQMDRNCSAGPEGNWSRFPWGLPTRYKIWELLWAHRDYFWRLGLCLGHEHDGLFKDEF